MKTRSAAHSATLIWASAIWTSANWLMEAKRRAAFSAKWSSAQQTRSALKRKISHLWSKRSLWRTKVLCWSSRKWKIPKNSTPVFPSSHRQTMRMRMDGEISLRRYWKALTVWSISWPRAGSWNRKTRTLRHHPLHLQLIRRKTRNRQIRHSLRGSTSSLPLT